MRDFNKHFKKYLKKELDKVVSKFFETNDKEEEELLLTEMTSINAILDAIENGVQVNE